jgi:uncharacterized membrane protein
MTEGTTPRDPQEDPLRQQPGGTPPPPAPPPGDQGWGQQGGYQPQGGYRSQPAGSGLSENVASGLSYVLGWLTGLIFLLIDKRPEVRFHALQSIIFAVVAMLFGWIRLFTSGFLATLLWLVSVVFFFTWIFVMIQAFQGRHFKLPVIGDFAEQQAGGPTR